MLFVLSLSQARRTDDRQHCLVRGTDGRQDQGRSRQACSPVRQGNIPAFTHGARTPLLNCMEKRESGHWLLATVDSSDAIITLDALAGARLACVQCVWHCECGAKVLASPLAAAFFVPISVSSRTHARVARAQCAARRRLCTRT